MKIHTKTATVALVTLAGLYGANAMAHGEGSHNETVTQSYEFSDFDEIKVGGVFEVDIQVGETHSIVMEGDPKLMERVKVSVKDDVLHLGHEKYNKKKGNKHSHSDGVTATITLPKLNALSVSGVASSNIEGVEAGAFDLYVSGVAEVDIEGTCDKLDAHISGVGELDASEFKCKNADISLSGVGEMSVYASESIDVKASGVGSVDVYGKPSQVSKSKSMFTDINMR